MTTINKYMKLSASARGFTLIELMVVVAIIAILAVVGYTIYNGAQGSARDGVRRSELKSLQESIESSKDYGLFTYKYTGTGSGTDYDKDFPRALTNIADYCINSDTTTTPPSSPAVLYTGCSATSGGAVIAGWKTVSSSMSGTSSKDLGQTTSDVKAWILCAALERTTTPFCVTSLTR